MAKDWRIPLPEGTILDDKYTIKKCVASGGSCLLYDCIYEDSPGNKVEVYIKELFPKEPENAITRESNGSLEWKPEYLVQKSRKIRKFKNACEHLNEFYKKLSLNTSYQQDCFEANNTCYNVVAKSFAGTPGDEFKDATIKDILLVIEDLTCVIKKYHEAGYLHLDIKPQNFLVSKDAAGNNIIQLFDLDSIVSIDQSGHVKPGNSITFTTGFCAPEIEMLNFGYDEYARLQIGAWTDIYSIGMVMLQYICGAIPNSFYDEEITNYLDCTNFSDSKVFKEKNGNSFNPAVKRKVKSILKKCLEELFSDRYQKTDELIDDLREAIDLCKCPYLVTSIAPSLDNFIGRGEEIRQIEKSFSNGQGTVLLHGVGGSGKTCVAHEYWKQKKDEYDVGVYLDYAGGHSSQNGFDELLSSSVTIMKYNGDSKDPEYNKKRLEQIKELLNREGVLILLDNFDMINEHRKEYKKFLENLQNNCPKAKAIVTTRTDIKEVFDGKLKENTKQIEIGALSFEDSFKLFSQGCGKDISGQEKAYKKLYELEKGNTLALDILSRLYKKDSHRYDTIEDIYNNLSERRSLGRIRVYEDKNAGEALCDIFDVAGLQDNEKRALGIVYLFRRTDLNTKLIYKIYGDYGDYCGDDLINDLNDLRNAGWVTESEGSYFLHPLVKFAVREKIKPDIADYLELKDFEFYMYFSFAPLFHINPFQGRGIDQTVCVLKSHFEIADKNTPLQKLVLPKDTPLLHFSSVAPFFCLTKAQVEGKLGDNISIADGNEYYESENNCIYKKPRKFYSLEESSELLFMGIGNSTISEQRDVEIIPKGACSFNRNKTIVVPESVNTIQRDAFFGVSAPCEEIDLPSQLKTVCAGAFRKIKKETCIVFNAIPKNMSINAFEESEATISFKKGNVKKIKDCYVDFSDNSLLLISKYSERIEIPDAVKKIKSPIKFTGIEDSILHLPEGIEEIAPGALRGFKKIEMDGKGKHYMIVGNSLVEKDANGNGTIVYRW